MKVYTVFPSRHVVVRMPVDKKAVVVFIIFAVTMTPFMVSFLTTPNAPLLDE